jgi:hypothetical protein
MKYAGRPTPRGKREAQLAAGDGRSGISQKGAITFAEHLAIQSDVLRRLACHPVLAVVCADLVGENVNLHWDQAVYKDPERPRRFPWHQDNGYAFVLPQQYLTCWLPLVPATIENRCPQIVPGLQRHGTLRHYFVDPLGWGVLQRASPDERCGSGRSGRRASVLVVDSAPHRTQPDWRGAQGLHPPDSPVGTMVLEGDSSQGPPPSSKKPCDSPELHLPVAREGLPVSGGA